ncbi:MAG: MBL fold metallo-hydrolase [Chloroflexi bacterium]|nr:MBL fold metallo-hydrolase [Chloroflexota bacterium]
MSSDSLLIGNLEVRAIALGPAVTNAYLVGDPDTELAVVIDPAWDGDRINREAELRGWRIHQIWLTHGHFDHFGGAGAISEASATPIPVALHADDHSLWRMGGGASAFGISDFDPGPEPTVNLEHGMMLRLGAHEFEVRHTPGHSPGHVILKYQQGGAVFCGDLIFRGSVGRTDLPGGDMQTLLSSIQQEVLTLSDEVQLLVGHGPATSVGMERRTNPFLSDI